MHTLPDITTGHLPPAGHPARDTPPNLDAGQPHRPTQPAVCEAIIFLTYFNYAENIICRYVAAQGRWRGAAGLPAGAAGPAGQGSRRQPREVQILEKLRKFRYIRRRANPRSVRTSYLFYLTKCQPDKMSLTKCHATSLNKLLRSSLNSPMCCKIRHARFLCGLPES